MVDLDWLELCRRVVGEQRLIFDRIGSIRERTEFEGVGKGGDLTLVIDRLCEDAIFSELERLGEQGHSFRAISEERGEVTFGQDPDPAVLVVIDPIDGSLNARRTIPQHSFCLGVASGPTMADVEFGFVHNFGSNEEFTARRGRGAELNGRHLRLSGGEAGAGEPGAEGPAERRAMEVVGLESADPQIASRPIAALGQHVHRLRVVGSIAITTCQVAAGRFDGMISLRACRSVDAAAAQLIVREAGGVVALGPGGLEAVGFGLDQRFPIAAAANRADLEILIEAQGQSPGLKTS